MTSNNELKKHINTIHCSNNMSLVQRKLFNALLFNAYPYLQNKFVFTITAKKLCQLIGYHSNDYDSLKKALIGMMGTVIEWNIINQDAPKTEQWRASSLVSAAEFKSGVCTYEFSSILKEYLYQPEMYGKIDIKLQANFKSVYGLALYENCVRYQNIKQTPWIPLEIFRKLMGVNSSKYVIFRDLKKRVIDKAIFEVNHFSNMTVLFNLLKTNRKVTAIKFFINKKFISNDVFYSEVETPLKIKLIEDFCFSDTQLNKIFSNYDDEYIKNKINYIENTQTFKAGKITNLATYLINALEKNYQSSKTSKDIIYAKIKKEELKKQIERDTIKNLEIQQRKNSELIALKIDEVFNSQPINYQDKIKEDFLDDAKITNNRIILQKISKNGFENKIVKACFREFLKTKYPEFSNFSIS